jgi:hypothetical protein
MLQFGKTQYSQHPQPLRQKSNRIMEATLNEKPHSDPLAPKRWIPFRVVFWVGFALCVSGLAHLAIYVILGASWHGPLSLRKPILFGISGGLTTWSIGWLMTQLRPMKYDRFLINTVAIALLVEVGLITMQYWRGVASHFNHKTNVDATIEFSMLALILVASFAIVYLSVRTLWLRNGIEPAMATAIRGGMWLLSLSCGLGMATSVLGEVSISQGSSYEVWGKAGVLKFPHGVALHAIQLLPFVAWLARVLKVTNSVSIVRSALASQIVFLVYAVWQTSQGRDRFDWDTIGVCTLGLSVMLAAYAAFAIVAGGLRAMRTTS